MDKIIDIPHTMKFKNIKIRYHENKHIDNFISWNPIIAVHNNQIIRDSNSYLFEQEIKNYYYDKSKIIYNGGQRHIIKIPNHYEKYYEIYKNIIINYNEIINSSVNNTINYTCVYLGCAFLDSNIGHALSYIFSILSHYIKFEDGKLVMDNNIKFVITNNTLPNVIKILEIFLNESQIIKLEEFKVYEFNNIIIHKTSTKEILCIENFPEIVKYILESQQVQMYKDKDLENKNIFMVKSHNNNKIGFPKYSISNNLIDYFNNNNILYIKPEDYNIYELIYMLNNASVILTSGGAISYTHMIFFNKNAKLYFLGEKYHYSNTLNFTYINSIDANILKNIYE